MASDFLSCGNSAVNVGQVTHAEWDGGVKPPTIKIITTSGTPVTLSADHEDAEKVAKAVGLGAHYDEWAKEVKAAEKAKAEAEARVAAKAAAEVAAAEAHAEEVAKHEAKILADAAKAAEKEEHAKKAHAHK